MSASTEQVNDSALLGGFIGAATGGGLYLAYHSGSLSLGSMIAIWAGVTLVAYLLGNYYPDSDDGQEPIIRAIVRGLLVGLNAVANGWLSYVIYGALFNTTVGLIAALALGLLTFVAALSPISKSAVYQGFLAWLSWFMPAAWGVIGLGLVLMILNVIGAVISLFGSDFFALKGARFDAKTGTLFVKGGFVSNLNFRGTAFNMGHMAFVSKDSSDYHLDHESGHTLNLAAFGTLFHFIGAIDENLIGKGAAAFAERLADSNAGLVSGAIGMWV